MPDSPNKLSQFWQELKRRKVLYFLIGYVATCFAIIEFSTITSDTFTIPDNSVKLIYIIATIGLPVVIILPWFIYRKQDDVDKDDLASDFKSPAQEKSIIVLPFENISPDPDQEYFSDGLTEEIITDLSYINDLLVISRSSSMIFKGAKKAIKEIAEEVNVKYVLEGSVRKEGNNLRIVAQLIDASSDSHLWAEKYSGTLDDVFDIQEKVSKSIADSLRIKLSPHEDQQITEQPIENVQAYEYYLKAKYEISQYTGDSLIRAKQLIENALEITGDDALLYATLGFVKNSLFDAGIVTDETILDDAELDAKKSLSINPDLAQGYFLLALLERGRGNLMKGYTYIKKAYENDPDDSTILVYTASFLGTYAGQPLLAKPLLEKLMKNDPLNLINYAFMGFNYYAFGNLEKAIELMQKASLLAPEFPWSKYWHAVYHAIKNKSEESILLLDQAAKLQHLPEIHINLLSFYKAALKGDNKSALSVLTEDTKNYIWNDPDITAFFPGWYAMTGQIEDALKLFEHAVNRGWINYPLFNEYDPLLENIRGEERFKKLMEKVKYEWENFEV